QHRHHQHRGPGHRGLVDPEAGGAEQAAEQQAYEEEITTLQGRIAELERTADDYQEQVAALETELTTRDGELAALEQRLSQTERELATVLQKKADLKASIDQMSAALEELRQRKAATDQRIAAYRDMLERFKGLIDAGKLKVSIIDGRMVLTLPMDILFASGKADLTEEGRASLLEVGAVLATVRGREYQVEGHTDNVPIKTSRFPSNWELGASRALVVLRTLMEAGVPGEQLSAATFGELRPHEKNDTAQGRAANRRIEI
ncbi:MAG: OmpA family protein, partial [Planctomycetes bacterium]|nr:OmpA family protein [Planctomycetota bacterium]